MKNNMSAGQHQMQQPQVGPTKRTIKKISELYYREPGLVKELHRRKLLNDFCLQHEIENDFAKRVAFGKAAIRKIAKKYGFGIEFSAMYDAFPTSMFWRLNDEENDFYFATGLPNMEEDRFEDQEHCESYFSTLQERFYEEYPQFNKSK